MTDHRANLQDQLDDVLGMQEKFPALAEMLDENAVVLRAQIARLDEPLPDPGPDAELLQQQLLRLCLFYPPGNPVRVTVEGVLAEWGTWRQRRLNQAEAVITTYPGSTVAGLLKQVRRLAGA